MKKFLKSGLHDDENHSEKRKIKKETGRMIFWSTVFEEPKGVDEFQIGRWD